MGGGDEPARGQVPQEAEPQQRGEAEGGHPGERHALLRLRVHEGEPLPAHEGALRPRGQALPGTHDHEHDVPGEQDFKQAGPFSWFSVLLTEDNLAHKRSNTLIF